MRLEDGNGLDVVESLREVSPEARVIMLTGYGNIAQRLRRSNAVPWTILPSLPMPMKFTPR